MHSMDKSMLPVRKKHKKTTQKLNFASLKGEKQLKSGCRPP